MCCDTKLPFSLLQYVMFSEFLILFFPGLSPRTATWNAEPQVGSSAVWHSLNAAGSHQVSYKHLVHVSWSDFALLTPCCLTLPAVAPATFPQSNLTHSPASACNVDFPQITQEPYICSYQQVYFRFLHFLMKIILADWCCRWRSLMKALTTPKLSLRTEHGKLPFQYFFPASCALTQLHTHLDHISPLLTRIQELHVEMGLNSCGSQNLAHLAFSMSASTEILR